MKETELKVARMLTKFNPPCWLAFLSDFELDSIPKALFIFELPGVRHPDHQCREQTKRDITSGLRDKLEGGGVERRQSNRVARFLNHRGVRLQKAALEI